eukprot:c16600_g1_i1 orf=219-473(+)
MLNFPAKMQIFRPPRLPSTNGVLNPTGKLQCTGFLSTAPNNSGRDFPTQNPKTSVVNSIMNGSLQGGVGVCLVSERLELKNSCL